VAPTHEDPFVRSSSEVVGGPSGRRSLGHPWWTPVRVVLAVACVAWLLAMVQKAPCAADDWSGENSRYAQMCYSDVPYLYVGRGFAEAALPYADSGGRYPDLEYPVLIGYFAHGTALLTQLLHGGADLEARRAAPADTLYADPDVEAERQDFFLVTAVLLAPFLLLSAWFLAGAHRGRPWDAMGFVAAPALVLTGLVNWDVLAIVCLTGAMWAWARGRPLLSGVLVGLGTATKLYPLFLLGALLVVAIRRRQLPAFGTAVVGAVIAWTAVDLPAMLGSWDGWRGFWSFNSDRGADLGSLWLLATNAGATFSPSTINRVSAVVFVLVCVGVLVLGLRARHVPRIPQLAFLVLVGFLLVNKVYSPQYVLWLLPLAVLARPRWRDLLIWQAGEVFYFVMVWMYLGQFTAPSTSGEQDAAYSWAIAVRVLAELYLAAVVVRDVVRPWRDPVRLSAGGVDEDPMSPPEAVRSGSSGRTPSR
jgi:uncharacterized membrane protein